MPENGIDILMQEEELFKKDVKDILNNLSSNNVLHESESAKLEESMLKLRKFSPISLFNNFLLDIFDLQQMGKTEFNFAKNHLRLLYYKDLLNKDRSEFTVRDFESVLNTFFVEEKNNLKNFRKKFNIKEIYDKVQKNKEIMKNINYDEIVKPFKEIEKRIGVSSGFLERVLFNALLKLENNKDYLKKRTFNSISDLFGYLEFIKEELEKNKTNLKQQEQKSQEEQTRTDTSETLQLAHSEEIETNSRNVNNLYKRKLLETLSMVLKISNNDAIKNIFELTGLDGELEQKVQSAFFNTVQEIKGDKKDHIKLEKFKKNIVIELGQNYSEYSTSNLQDNLFPVLLKSIEFPLTQEQHDFFDLLSYIFLNQKIKRKDFIIKNIKSLQQNIREKKEPNPNLVKLFNINLRQEKEKIIEQLSSILNKEYKEKEAIENYQEYFTMLNHFLLNINKEYLNQKVIASPMECINFIYLNDKFRQQQTDYFKEQQLKFMKVRLLCNLEIINQNDSKNKLETNVKRKNEIIKYKNELKLLEFANIISSKEHEHHKQEIEKASSKMEKPAFLSEWLNAHFSDIERKKIVKIINDLKAFEPEKILERIVDEFFNEEKSNEETILANSAIEELESNLFWSLTHLQSSQAFKKRNFLAFKEKVNPFFTFLYQKTIQGDRLLNPKELEDLKEITFKYFQLKHNFLLYKERLNSHSLINLRKIHEQKKLLENLEKIKSVFLENNEDILTRLQFMTTDKRFSESIQKAAKLRLTEYKKRTNNPNSTSKNDNKEDAQLRKFTSLPYKESEISNNLNEAKKELIEEYPWFQTAIEKIFSILETDKYLTGASQKAICLKSGPGFGKTTFAAVLAKKLKLKFHKISLSGAKDPQMIEGFDYTYEGSKEGELARALIETGVTNPLIFIDELEKAENPVQNASLDLFESEQRKAFKDKYLKVPVDLSKAIIITAINSEDTLIEPLKNRLTIIDIPEITQEQREQALTNSLNKMLSRDKSKVKKKVTFSPEVIPVILGFIDSKEDSDPDGLRDINESAIEIAKEIYKKLASEPEITELKITLNNLNNYYPLIKDYNKSNSRSNDQKSNPLTLDVKKSHLVCDNPIIEPFPGFENPNVKKNEQEFLNQAIKESLSRISKTFPKLSRAHSFTGKKDKSFKGLIDNVYQETYFKNRKDKFNDFKEKILNHKNSKISVTYDDGSIHEYDAFKQGELGKEYLVPGENILTIPNPYQSKDKYDLENYDPKVKNLVNKLITEIRKIEKNMPVHPLTFVPKNEENNPSAKEYSQIFNLANVIITLTEIWPDFKVTKNKNDSTSEQQAISKNKTDAYETKNKNSSMGPGSAFTFLSGNRSSGKNKIPDVTSKNENNAMTINDGITINSFSLVSNETLTRVILDTLESESKNLKSDYRSLIKQHRYKSIEEIPKKIDIKVNISEAEHFTWIMKSWSHIRQLMEQKDYPCSNLLEDIEDDVLLKIDAFLKQENVSPKYKLALQFLANDISITLEKEFSKFPILSEIMYTEFYKNYKEQQKLKQKPIKITNKQANLAIKYYNIKHYCYELMSSTALEFIDKEEKNNRLFKVKILSNTDYFNSCNSKTKTEVKSAIESLEKGFEVISILSGKMPQVTIKKRWGELKEEVNKKFKSDIFESDSEIKTSLKNLFSTIFELKNDFSSMNQDELNEKFKEIWNKISDAKTKLENKYGVKVLLPKIWEEDPLFVLYQSFGKDKDEKSITNVSNTKLEKGLINISNFQDFRNKFAKTFAYVKQAEAERTQITSEEEKQIEKESLIDLENKISNLLPDENKFNFKLLELLNSKDSYEELFKKFQLLIKGQWGNPLETPLQSQECLIYPLDFSDILEITKTEFNDSENDYQQFGSEDDYLLEGIDRGEYYSNSAENSESSSNFEEKWLSRETDEKYSSSLTISPLEKKIEADLATWI